MDDFDISILEATKDISKQLKTSKDLRVSKMCRRLEVLDGFISKYFDKSHNLFNKLEKKKGLQVEH